MPGSSNPEPQPGSRDSNSLGRSSLRVPKPSSEAGGSDTAAILQSADDGHASPDPRLLLDDQYRSGSNASPDLLGNSIFYDDVVDYRVGAGAQATPDPALTQKAISQVQAKIEKIKEHIREEQKSRDENVNEYLKLSSNADRQQQVRIKQVFEKKNQKSAQNIVHYQKKLEEYQKKLQDLQEHGIRPRQSRKLGEGLKSVGGNIRDGITGMSSTVMAKPKEFAHRLRHR